MAADISKMLESIVDKMDLIKAEEIPSIDLYMDQVTTFMESHLGKLKRNPEDKVLTKTMINNYAKNNLLPSPEKKRYSKNHVLLLTFIYYFKNVLSITDIKTLMEKLTKNHFPAGSELSLESIYGEVIKFQPEIVDMVRDDLKKKTEMANTSFEGEDKDAEYLKLFALLSLLSFDVYIKKQLIESVIDNMHKLDAAQALKDAAALQRKEKRAREKAKIKEKEDVPTTY